jgi:hypothetical protein
MLKALGSIPSTKNKNNNKSCEPCLDDRGKARRLAWVAGWLGWACIDREAQGKEGSPQDLTAIQLEGA